MHTRLQHMGMSRLDCSMNQGRASASDPRLRPLLLPASCTAPPTLSVLSLDAGTLPAERHL